MEGLEEASLGTAQWNRGSTERCPYFPSKVSSLVMGHAACFWPTRHNMRMPSCFDAASLPACFAISRLARGDFAYAVDKGLCGPFTQMWVRVHHSWNSISGTIWRRACSNWQAPLQVPGMIETAIRRVQKTKKEQLNSLRLPSASSYTA